jgi:hypothetical protein
MSSRGHKARRRRRRARRALSNRIHREKLEPFKKISVGEFCYWIDEATNKPVIPALQFALNLGNIMDVVTKMIKKWEREMRKAKR